MWAVTAFAGALNVTRYAVKLAGQPFVFQPGQRVTVEAGNAMISSDTTAVSMIGAELSIQFGQLELPAGMYDVLVTVFEPNETTGQVLAGPGLPAAIALTMRSTTPCSC